ncbi:MAG: phage holin family protein [Rikenellaceae bacterium]|nr:phage holin family protein [Rikenellaceae bacterium]MCL2693011.1 phage holin family protein [Rikenellaceae bacterium]
MAEENLKEQIAHDLKRFVDLRIDNAKLAAVEGLAVVAGGAIGLIICLFLVNLALVLFSGVFVYLINLLVDSWVWSAVILGGIYLIIGILVLAKSGCFRNRMVRIFAPMFFCPKKHEEDDDE